MNHEPFLQQPHQHQLEMCSTSLDKSLLSTNPSSVHDAAYSISIPDDRTHNDIMPEEHFEEEQPYTDTYLCCLKRLLYNCLLGLVIDSFNSGILSDDV